MDLQKGGFNNLIVESDARDMIRMVNKEIVVDASLESIMHDIWSIVNGVRAVLFDRLLVRGDGIEWHIMWQRLSKKVGVV